MNGFHQLSPIHGRPSSDLPLFTLEFVDFGLKRFRPNLLPFLNRFLVFHEALDQQVLDFGDSGAFFWGQTFILLQLLPPLTLPLSKAPVSLS
jgi:hypothetical protein